MGKYNSQGKIVERTSSIHHSSGEDITSENGLPVQIAGSTAPDSQSVPTRTRNAKVIKSDTVGMTIPPGGVGYLHGASGSYVDNIAEGFKKTSIVLSWSSGTTFQLQLQHRDTSSIVFANETFTSAVAMVVLADVKTAKFRWYITNTDSVDRVVKYEIIGIY